MHPTAGAYAPQTECICTPTPVHMHPNSSAYAPQVGAYALVRERICTSGRAQQTIVDTDKIQSEIRTVNPVLKNIVES